MTEPSRQLRESVRLAVELQLGRDVAGMEARLAEDLEADSFDVMNIIVALEEQHGITITEEAAASVWTVEDLVSLVARLAPA